LANRTIRYSCLDHSREEISTDVRLVCVKKSSFKG
jgi:hypothetical protein